MYCALEKEESQETNANLTSKDTKIITMALCISSVDGNCRGDGVGHKVLTYIEYQSVCLLVGIGTPPPL